MESPAMQKVLESPELLTRICEIIHKDEKFARVRSSLPSAARVNSWWRDIVCRILWAEPPAEALVEVRRNRRQIYASQIRRLSLSFEQDPTFNTLFGGLQFPRIQDLSLSTHSSRRIGRFEDPNEWNTTVSQYFGPALEILDLHGCNAVCTPTFFTDVAVRSPRLKKVKLTRLGPQLHGDSLSNFFEACKHLVDITLNFVPDTTRSLITNDLLLCLSRMEKLEVLEIEGHLDRWESFRTIKDQNSAPFTSLTKFDLDVSLEPVHYVFLHSGASSPRCAKITLWSSTTLFQSKLSPPYGYCSEIRAAVLMTEPYTSFVLVCWEAMWPVSYVSHLLY
jgi:hypothetical protein